MITNTPSLGFDADCAFAALAVISQVATMKAKKGLAKSNNLMSGSLELLAINVMFGIAHTLIYVYSVNMQDNDNSVNINLLSSPYHHGDLRAALINTGLELLKARKVEDFSLREVARSVGVSATAVYRHFPDKNALLDALREKGSVMLAEAQRAAIAKSSSTQQGFDNSGIAYVHFAIANPSLFRLMMKARTAELVVDSGTTLPRPALEVLQTTIKSVMPKDATEKQKQLRAVRSWSLVHGIAMLVLDGKLAYDEEMIAAIIRMPLD